MNKVMEGWFGKVETDSPLVRKSVLFPHLSDTGEKLGKNNLNA